MNSAEVIARIESCYKQYCGVIKPLIAQIEATSEKIPLPLFNEIRAFNDHIARCFYNNPSDEYIAEQIDRAERHIVRMTLDCFKCLNVILFQKIELFESQTRNVDLTVIDNGSFYPTYAKQKIEAARIIKMAKISESQDTYQALEYYQNAYNIYAQVVDNIDSISEKVKWAKVRFTIKRWGAIVGWVISVILSAIISAMLAERL